MVRDICRHFRNYSNISCLSDIIGRGWKASEISEFSRHFTVTRTVKGQSYPSPILQRLEFPMSEVKCLTQLNEEIASWGLTPI